jgi:sugar transferase (PEP-CTERM/EpsH1 system associated)
MRVLVLDEEIPWPLDTGKKIRTFNLLSRLCRTNKITYTAYIDREREPEKIVRFESLGITVVPVADRRVKKESKLFYLELMKNLLSRYPYIVSGHFTDKMQKAVNRLVGENDFDLIHCEISPYGIFLDKYNGVPKVIVAHNVESDIWRRYQKFERSAVKKAYIKVQLKKLIRYESSFLKKFDGCITVSEQDADYLRKHGWDSAAYVVDNGVDIEFFKPSRERPENSSLVFTGSMDWRPNQDAVLYFVREILPLIRTEIPDVKFTVVGRKPSAEIRRLETEAPGVRVTGTVDDVRPYMSRSQVYVVPLRIGGGSRLKILEAMAMGKPIISTRVGAEGLRIKDGENIILADSSADFAVNTVELLRDPSRMQVLGENGRKLVEDTYSWDALADQQDIIWRGIGGTSMQGENAEISRNLRMC